MHALCTGLQDTLNFIFYNLQKTFIKIKRTINVVIKIVHSEMHSIFMKTHKDGVEIQGTPLV